MKINKLIFLPITILILIFIFVIYLLFFTKNKQQSVTPVQEPTPTIRITTTPIEPTNTLRYPAGSIGNIVNKVKNKQPLTEQDQQIKNQLIQISQKDSDNGSVYQTNDYIITYDSDFDDFEIELLSPQIQTAKTNAINWFKNQGLSDNGICNLPLVFFINGNTKLELQNQNITFNPLPDFCQ